MERHGGIYTVYAQSVMLTLDQYVSNLNVPSIGLETRQLGMTSTKLKMYVEIVFDMIVSKVKRYAHWKT